VVFNEINYFSGCVSRILECLEWLRATKQEILEADGRADRDNDISRCGSCIYIAYAGNEVLYIGETSKSIKRRFVSDGSGAHQSKGWFPDMTDIKYMIFSENELPEKHRKLLEQALSIHYNPKYYGRT